MQVVANNDMQDMDVCGGDLFLICIWVCICKYADCKIVWVVANNDDMQDMDTAGEMREEQMDIRERILTRQEWRWNWNKSGHKMDVERKWIEWILTRQEWRWNELEDKNVRVLQEKEDECNGHGMDVK